MMNVVKIDLCNKMGDEWINDSMFGCIQNGVFATIDNEAILQRFKKCKLIVYSYLLLVACVAQTTILVRACIDKHFMFSVVVLMKGYTFTLLCI